MKKLLMIFLLAISSAAFGQGSQLSQLDGSWLSPDSNYGYILTNGIGIATQTNSPKFKIGDKIIELQSSGNNSFQGTHIYQNGKFYPILTTLISENRMLVQGEHSVAWYMDRVRGTTYTPQTPLAPAPWNLNGSKLSVTIINGILNIYFIEPSKELVTSGARSDSLLLSGTVNGELVQGNAKLYVQKCGVFTYPVSGRLSLQQTRLELTGMAPVVNRQTCAINTTEPQSLTLQTEQQTSASSASPSISSTLTGQGSQLSQLDGEWYSNQWKYGYTLTSGVGVATSTNSPNFKVGDRIIFLQQSSDKTFEGTQVYTDGKFYKITVQQQSKDTLLFKGEKNVSWIMTKKTQTTTQAATSTTSTNAQATNSTTLATASPVAPLAPVSSAPPSRRQLPPCQGSDPRGWNNCEGTTRTGDGNMYRGEFRDGRANGYGTLEGNFKYVGEVRDGVPQGLGTYTISNAAYTGQFNGGSRWMADENFNGIWTIASPEGRVFFVGELKDRRPMGKGTVTLKNDNKYTGFFKRGVLVLLNTSWTVNYPNGDTYVGKLIIQDCEDCEFNMSHLNGAKRNGQGVITSSNGDKYVGEFKNDMKYGPGQGISTYQDGSKYVGPYKDGRRHGQGTLTYLNGDKYVGNWQDDYQSGQGTFSATNGDKYIGEFKDGRRYGQGQGISTYQDGSKYVGPYRDGGRSGQGTQTTNNGDTYVGDWTNDKRNGRGTLTSSNGDKYVGDWKDDSQHGQGTFTASNDDKYVGEFKDGKRHGDGQGVLTYPDGSKYAGPFKDGMRHTNLAPYGQGTLTATNGNTYVGEWKDNKRNGQGTSTSSDGDKYVGDWINDKRNGKGTFTSTRDGTKYVGDWKDDVRQGQGTLTFSDGRIETGTWRSDVYISEAELARERAAIAEQERIAKERIAEQERLARERIAEQERLAKEQLIKENNLIYGTTGVGLKLENVNQTNAASGRKWFVTATVRNNQKQTVKNLKLDCKQYNPQNVEVKNVDAVVIREAVVSEVVPSGELRNINFDLDWNRGSTYVKCLVISSSPN